MSLRANKLFKNITINTEDCHPREVLCELSLNDSFKSHSGTNRHNL